MNESLMNDNSPDTCCDQTPKGIETQTQLTPDMLPADEPHKITKNRKPTDNEIIESVVELNPDVNSMDSRG